MKSFFKNILSTILAILTSVFIIIILLFGIISTLNSNKGPIIKPNSILTIDLANTAVVERTTMNPLQEINPLSGEMEKTIELKQILDNIEKAKTDNNIKAIYIKSSFINAGLSQIEEIRNKLLEFKTTGKPIISYGEIYSQSAYNLASIANTIYLNPEGMIDLKG